MKNMMTKKIFGYMAVLLVVVLYVGGVLTMVGSSWVEALKGGGMIVGAYAVLYALCKEEMLPNGLNRFVKSLFDTSDED